MEKKNNNLLVTETWALDRQTLYLQNRGNILSTYNQEMPARSCWECLHTCLKPMLFQNTMLWFPSLRKAMPIKSSLPL